MISTDLTAFPLDAVEHRRSGTWSTVRRAWKAGRTVVSSRYKEHDMPSDHWTEFVHITATTFHAGEYPFTMKEFYENSLPQRDTDPFDLFFGGSQVAPATVDPIVITVFEHEGPRVAESNEWWNCSGELWSIDNLPLDDNYKLTQDVIRLGFSPLTTGFFIRDDTIPQESLILYNIHSMSTKDVFEDHVQDILDLIKKCNKEDKDKVYLMTLWSCSAGFSYIPGEPDDYDEDWYLFGAVIPEVSGVQFIPLEDEPNV